MFDWVLDTSLCSKHINNYFHRIYPSEDSDSENELLYQLIVSDQSDNVMLVLPYLVYKLMIRFYQILPVE